MNSTLCLALSRIVDAVLALIGIIVLFPLLLLPTILIHKMRIGGPTFFLQERIGYKGDLITVIKLRTFDLNGDNVLNDPFAKKLRTFCIDELPQLLHVITGKLALVGPRPLMLADWKKVKKIYPERTRVRPGLTGTVVSGMKIPDKVYVEELQGFWFDKLVVILTVRAIFLGRTEKAYVGESTAMQDPISSTP